MVDELKILTLYELKANGYPEDVLGEIQIVFTTDEDIQRETGGNYWYYLNKVFFIKYGFF